MRDWLTFIIVLLIVVILIDGVRRMRLARRDRIRMSPSIYKNQTRDDSPTGDFYTSELPNGGARVVGQREHFQRDPLKKNSAKNRSVDREQSRPEQTKLNLDAAVPMLMESITENHSPDKTLAKVNTLTTNIEGVAAKTLAAARDFASRGYQTGNESLPSSERIEPSLGVDGSASSETDYERNDHHPRYPEQATATNTYDEDDESGFEEGDYEDEETSGHSSGPVEDDYEDDAYYEEDAETEEDYHSVLDDEADDEADDEDYQEDDYQVREDIAPMSTQREYSRQSERPAAEPEEVLIINVMASKAGSFKGDQLLDVLLKCGMRFGDMDIFHRYSDSKGDGALLFSLANMVKPGTFDLDAMDKFETPGVSLFMTLPIKADSMQSFELMVDTARSLADALDGEIKDEQRSVMTRQTIDHCRERIRDFERRRLFSRQR